MNLSSFCIHRPVATILLSISLILSGVFAYKFLPVAALPRAEFPIINVSAQLPGAAPETMATAVATPLIKQFSIIAGIESISSTNAQGSTSIAIQFVLDRNIDAAAADVQAAIARAQRQLPAEMTNPPSYRKVNPADSPVLLLAIRSENLKLSELDAFSQQVISPTLSTLDGVAQVQIFGSQKYAVRIEINPIALFSRGIGIDELQTALSAANSNIPVGSIQNLNQFLIIQANTQLKNAKEFQELIISIRDGSPVRLKDVAIVEDSVENSKTASWFDGARALIIAVYRQPDANTVDVVDLVKATIPSFKEQLPASAEIFSFNDRSVSIRNAVGDVKFTLILTIVLVILVIFLFLRRVSATIIPSLAIPISLIATLSFMYLFKFSIDNISLLGLTLAVGLVVDDAIVMLENIHRYMEKRQLSAFEAALIGSKEIGFTILSISFSLVAVFLPILLMGGVIGRIFNEFAVVVTVSILASAFVSLTLTPMLCAYFINSSHMEKQKESKFSIYLENYFNYLRKKYASGVRWSLRHPRTIFAVFIATCIATIFMIIAIPKGFFPQEDIGLLRVSTEARQDISFEAMSELQKSVATAFQNSPYVQHVAGSVGTSSFSASGMNAGRMFVELKPRSERPDINIVLADLRKDVGKIAGINTYIFPVQNLNIGAISSRSQYQYVLQAIDQAQLYDWSERLADAMRRDRFFSDISSDLQNKGLQATFVIDKDKAQSLGITPEQLRSSLYMGFGARQVATIYTTSDTYSVIAEFDPSFEWSADKMDFVRIRSRTSGILVPISAFARVDKTIGSVTVNQLGQLPAVTLSFNLPPGIALGEAVDRLEVLKSEISLPNSIKTSLAGTAQVFQQSLANQGMLIIAAIVTIYIILGILYESFIHPFTILTGIPSAVVGALGILYVFNMDLSVIAIIGILMLIGIVKKNAIMMVDVAIELRDKGNIASKSIYKAAILRFRPIMMTTLAAILGVLPIAIGTGASSELRQPLGLVVLGGLMVSQLLTLFITPVIYLWMERLAEFIKSEFNVFNRNL